MVQRTLIGIVCCEVAISSIIDIDFRKAENQLSVRIIESFMFVSDKEREDDGVEVE